MAVYLDMNHICSIFLDLPILRNIFINSAMTKALAGTTYGISHGLCKRNIVNFAIKTLREVFCTYEDYAKSLSFISQD